MKTLIKSNGKWLILLSFIYILPIILANVYYTDDMNRVLLGYGWGHDGRLLASVIMNIISFNALIPQFFPLSLLIATALSLLVGRIISSVIIDDDEKLAAICSLIFVTSPFYLENLSYRYDSIPMALSMLFVVSPFLLEKTKYFMPITIVGMVSAFFLYQTSVMGYFALLLCVLYKKIKSDNVNEILRLLIISASSFVISFFVFKLIMYFQGKHLERGSLIKLYGHFSKTIFDRLCIYVAMYRKLFAYNYCLSLIPLLLSVVFSVVCYLKMSAKKCAVSVLAASVLIALLFLLTTLPNLLINEPWYTARTMICYPFIVYFIVLFCSRGVNSKFLSFSVSVVLFFSFVLSSSFGSVLKNNDEYYNFLAESVSSKIMSGNTYSDYNVAILGNSGYARRSKLQYKIYPIMEFLAPNYMDHEWYWGVVSLSKYLNMTIITDRKIINDRCNYSIVDKTSLYNIYGKDNLFIVDFTKSCK